MNILKEEKGIATTALPFREGPDGTVIPVAKAINIVLNTRGTITGLDSQGNVHLKNANGNNYILAQGGRATLRYRGALPQMILDGQELIDKINSYKVDDIAKEKAEQYCKEQGLELTDSREFQINGLINAQDKNGVKYLLKVTSDPEDPREYIVIPYSETPEGTLEKVNEEPKERSKKQDNEDATQEAFANGLTKEDIMIIGGELSKYMRKSILNWEKTLENSPFKDVSVQVTSGKQESKIVAYKKLLEASEKRNTVTLRILISLIPDNFKEADWNPEKLVELLSHFKDQFVQKYAKGVRFKNGDNKFIANFSDANNIKCTDSKGLTGYFDVHATKVYKAKSGVGKAIGAFADFSNELQPMAKAGKGLGHN